MGNAKSSNYADILMQSNTDLQTRIEQDAGAGGNQSVFINQVCKEGVQTCGIENVDVDQDGNAATTAMQDAVANSSSVTNMNSKLKQAAESVAQGFNAFNFTEADNVIKTTMLARTNETASIQQKCKSEIQQNVDILQECKANNCNIEDVNIKQRLSTNVSKCAQKASISLESIQKLSSEVDQSSVTKIKGFSLLEIAIAILIVVGCVAVAGGGGTLVLKKVLEPSSEMAKRAGSYMLPLSTFAGFAAVAGVIIWWNLDRWEKFKIPRIQLSAMPNDDKFPATQDPMTTYTDLQNHCNTYNNDETECENNAYCAYDSINKKCVPDAGTTVGSAYEKKSVLLNTAIEKCMGDDQCTGFRWTRQNVDSKKCNNGLISKNLVNALACEEKSPTGMPDGEVWTQCYRDECSACSKSRDDLIKQECECKGKVYKGKWHDCGDWYFAGKCEDN